MAKSMDDEIERLTSQKKELDEKLKALTESRDAVYLDILKDVKEQGIKDQQVNDLFVTYFSKNEITWLDDAGLLKALQENGANKFIKVTTKTTTSVDKNELKKAFKADETLKEQYKAYYGDKLTEYVTITTAENHQKMVEHIKENQKGE